MGSIEIVIAVLIGLLALVCVIYFCYFSSKAYQKQKNRLESGEIDASMIHTGTKGITIGLVSYFALAALIFAMKLVCANAPSMGNEYWVSVNSSSMASALSSNTYIKENHLTEKIYCYDLAAFSKGNEGIKQYDVILFQKEGRYIVHRIITDPSNGEFLTQGDANIAPDEWSVNQIEVMGIYTHTVPFLSFLNYLSYTPGFYVAWAGATIALGAGIFFEFKNAELRKQAKNPRSMGLE